MKTKIIARLKTLPALICTRRWILPAVCYLLALCFTLVTAAVGLAIDSVHRANGTLVTRALTVQDFSLVNLHLEGDTLVSENEDPQLIYGPADTRLDSLALNIQYDLYPYERCLYYTTRPDEAFGQEKRVWAMENDDGSITFSLPAGVVAIRLDPGSRTNLHMELTDITLNPPRTAASYFVPDGGGWFALLVLPGLTAACLQWLAEFLRSLRGKHKEST